MVDVEGETTAAARVPLAVEEDIGLVLIPGRTVPDDTPVRNQIATESRHAHTHTHTRAVIINWTLKTNPEQDLRYCLLC